MANLSDYFPSATAQTVSKFDQAVMDLSPHAYYKFELEAADTTGEILADASGNGNDLYVIGGGNNYMSVLPPARKYSKQIVRFGNGRAAFFRDSDNNMNTLTALSTAFSLQSTFAWTENTGFQKVVGWRSSNSGQSVAIVTEYSSGFYVNPICRGSDGVIVGGGRTLSFSGPARGMSIMTMVWDAGDWFIWIDGTSGGSGTAAVTTIANYSDQFEIGGTTSGDFGSAWYTDHCSIFTKALTETEVLNMHSLYSDELFDSFNPLVTT